MKLAKGVVFFVLMIMLGSCFNPPEFPIEPQITFKDITFKRGDGGGQNVDSLILTLTFKDGDGDLGIDAGNPVYDSDPYHTLDYFLEKDGELVSIATENKYGDDLSPLIKVDAGKTGKLVSVRTRNKPGYENLPTFNCYSYSYDSIFVTEADKNIFDGTYFVKKIIPATANHPTIYHLQDTFYITPNTNHDNITVLFETKNSNGSYTEFKWEEEYCTKIYDSRFPILAENKVPLDGTLRYDMVSSGFQFLFGGKTLRLKVQIKDRALHVSNTITTPDFKIN